MSLFFVDCFGLNNVKGDTQFVREGAERAVPALSGEETDMKSVPEVAADTAPEEILRLGLEAAQGQVQLACSFSLEDVAIIELAVEAGLEIGVFALDTGRLNEETYEVADAIVER